MKGIDRLLELRQENYERAARQVALAPRFNSIRGALAGGGPVIATGFNLFQTPEPIAARMADILAERVGDNARILEPSAGLGRLINAWRLRAEWVAVEEARECINAISKMLKKAKPDLKHRDFLESSPEELGQFDGVLMNPPFQRGRDIKHVQHAINFLKPGGRLVGLCYNGVKQNKILRPTVDQWEVLEEGSFKSEGTGASVALFTIDK